MDDHLTPTEERDALAAELALGLLEGQTRADALRLSLSDPAFAAQVAAWEAKLAPLHDEWANAQPGAAVWSGIERQLADAPTDKVTAIEMRLRRWRAGALLSGAVAAALAFVLITQPVPTPTPAAPQLAVARIESDAAGPLVLARYNQSNGLMQLRIHGFEPGTLAPELWVIPEGGTPVSLGQIGHAGEAEMTMPPPHRLLMTEGATLAITMEPVSKTPHPAPSSVAVASGKIITI
ncbi:anti-sigma factor [Sphingopyxis sp.]|jgi:anti-sigma-K factor RskA|uniref:anti-sigma factor n=1 Tax=Sphingopyxis sp. TaxID=1908224 RepID=UPI001D4C0096|nr:anti-sigma factor [Sphingopyxis sp.]MBW8295826.1 anti-sigma factor [Sphingopyxis sp.]